MSDEKVLTSNRISLPRITAMGRQLEDTEPDYMAYYTSYEIARDEIDRLRAALTDLHDQVERFCTEQGEWEFYTGPALAALGKSKHEVHEHDLRKLLSCDPSAPETKAPQPIAWVVIAENGGICSSGTYAPGLPEGTHDLYYWGERGAAGTLDIATGDGPRFGSATEALLQKQRAKCAIDKTCLEYPRCRCGGTIQSAEETSESPALGETCPTHGWYRLNAAGCPVCHHEKQKAHSSGKSPAKRQLWCCDDCNCYNGPRPTCAHCGAPRPAQNRETDGG